MVIGARLKEAERRHPVRTDRTGIVVKQTGNQNHPTA
jgi:hypothetical protein